MITATLILAALVAVVSMDSFELPADEVEAHDPQVSTDQHPPRKLITSISPAKMQECGRVDEAAIRVAA